MTVTDAQALAIAKRVIEMLKTLRVVLKKAGLDVDLMVSTLSSLLDAATATEANQEAMKRQTKATTDAWLKLKKQMYTTASGYLDMAIAAVGKDTMDAKNLRMVRSRMSRPEADEKPSVTSKR